jgi:hypothetical protein
MRETQQDFGMLMKSPLLKAVAVEERNLSH